MKILAASLLALLLAGCGGKLDMAFRPDTRNGFVATIHTSATQGSPGSPVEVQVDLINQARNVCETTLSCDGFPANMQVFGPDGNLVRHRDPYLPLALCSGPHQLLARQQVSGGYVFDGRLWDAQRNELAAAPGRYVVVMRISGHTNATDTKTYELTTAFDWNTP